MGKAKRNKTIRRMAREGLTPGAPVSQLVIDRRRRIKDVNQVTAVQAKGTLRFNVKKMKRLAKSDPNVAAMVKSTESYHKMLRGEREGGAATFEGERESSSASYTTASTVSKS